MNWEHLKTYMWVRRRLTANQIRKAGIFSKIISVILAVLRIAGGVITFTAGLLIGYYALREAEPRIIMYVWDGITAGFILFWLIGLMSELQQNELLSLNNFMHLPVSPSGAFLINYAGSCTSLSLILFFPGMLGFSTGLTISKGPSMLFLFPLVVSFTLMLTAVTYQFRGWLAGMMTNPRRRKTIVAIMTAAFILVFQLPNLFTNFNPVFKERIRAREQAGKEMTELGKELEKGNITRKEYNARIWEKKRFIESESKRESEKVYESVRSANLVLPPGWLPYGAESASQGRLFPVAACMLGMALIGAVSLRRSYKSTIRLYRGDFNKGRKSSKRKIEPALKKVPKISPSPRKTTLFLEKTLPGISESASAVALAGFRSIWRSTEVKMMLLNPVILFIVFGGIFAGKEGDMAVMLRPFAALGFMSFMLIMSMTGFTGNMFAFDRRGFRSLVLSGIPRRDIILGKNLSFMPFPVFLMAATVCGFQWLHPMRIDHLVAMLIHIVPVYLIFCLAGNLLSILSPVTLKEGSGMPAQNQGLRMLFQFLFILVVPVPLAFTIIPLGIEVLFSFFGVLKGYPIFLILGIIQAVLVLWLYRMSLNPMGMLMQKHEKKILEVVSKKGE